jgi:hypothetical protein
MSEFTYKNDRNLVKLRPIGINEASTFTGFCKYHDNILFKPIESNDFKDNKEHAFLLGYRAICKELFLKKSQLELTETSFNKRGAILKAEEQAVMREYIMGIQCGLKSFNNIKVYYDKLLVEKTFDDYHYITIRIKDFPQFLCSGAIFPEYDFDGNQLQDFNTLNIIPDIITFSIIKTNRGGAIIFSWIGESTINNQFIASLLKFSDKDKPDAICRFTFEFFENTYFSPLWWDKLSIDVKEDIFIRQQRGILFGDYEERPNDCLQNNMIKYVQWTVSSIKQE